MIRLFKGTCEAVRAMHSYRPTSPRSATLPPERTNKQNGNAAGAGSSSRDGGPSAGQRLSHEDHDDDERFPHPEGDTDGGYSYDNATVPLVTRHRVEEEGEVVFDGDEEAADVATGSSTEAGAEIVPYAHRDLKPGWVFCFS